MVGRHLSALANKHSPLMYGLLAAIEACACALFLAAIVATLGLEGDTDLQALYETNKAAALIVGLLIAPLLETALFQLAIQEILEKLRLRNTWVIGISWGAFALAHIGSVARFVIAGAVGGGYLTLTYRIWRHRGRALAFIATWALHFFYNAAILSITTLIELVG